MSEDYSPFTFLQNKTKPWKQSCERRIYSQFNLTDSLAVSPEEPSRQELLSVLEVPQLEAVKGGGPRSDGPAWVR